MPGAINLEHAVAGQKDRPGMMARTNKIADKKRPAYYILSKPPDQGELFAF